MKNIITLTLALILLPGLSMAQKNKRTYGSNIPSVKEFFDKYSEAPNYECIEVNEAMFEQFLKQDDLDQEFVNFLSSLKYIRFLEYKARPSIASSSGVARTNTVDGFHAENIYFVDGVRVKEGSKVTQAQQLRINHGQRGTGVSGAVSTPKSQKDSVVVEGKPVAATNIKSGKTVVGYPLTQTRDLNSANILYDRAKNEIKISQFTQLMKSTKDGEKLLFLKRDSGNGFTEYILLTGNTMINIMGDLDISHISQIEEVLEAVGEILPL